MRQINCGKSIGRILLVIAALIGAKASQAQTDGYLTNSNLRGNISFGSFHKGDIDNINLATGAVNLTIPLVTRKGRGLDTGQQFVYNSKLWTLTPVYDPNTGNLTDLFWQPSGERAASAQLVGINGGILDWTVNQYTCTYHPSRTVTEQYIVTILSNFVFIGPDGAKYQFANRVVTRDPDVGVKTCDQPFPGSDAPPAPPANNNSIPLGYSDSGTLQLNTSTAPYVVYFKDGRQAFTSPDNNGFDPVTYELMDSNGNVLNGSADTLGRTGFADSSGSAIAFTTSSSQLPTGTQFPTTGNSGCIHQYSFNISAVTQLQLPNGQSYGFTYDPNFGELVKVTLPTGGYIKYVYQAISAMDQNPFTLSLSGANTCYTGLLDSRRIVERHVSSDGTTEAVWHYSYSVSYNSSNALYTYQTTVTDPVGNVSVHTFPQLNGTDPGYETERDSYDNSGHLLMKTVNTWGSDGGPVQTNQDGSTVQGLKNARIVSTTTTLSDTGQVKQVNTVYDQSNTYNTLTSFGNATESRMNVMETDEYDYGSGGPGALLRKTVFDYLHFHNSAYLNLHIWDRVSSKTVYDGSSNTCQGIARPCAQVQYQYDSTSLTAASGAVAHDDAGHPASFTTRGNLTETDTWRNTDGALLSTKNWFDSLGNLIQTQDANGNVTTLSYADSWTSAAGGSTCAPSSGSTQALLTQVTNPLGHVTRHSYFSCSSLNGSTTDPNNQTTSWVYDHTDRVLSESRPDGGQSAFAYTDPVSASPGNPVSAQEQLTIGNGATLTQTVVADGLGRISQSQLNSDPQGADYTDTTYDSLGRVASVSNPHRFTSNATDGTTYTQYDALGRPTITTLQDGSVATSSYSGNCSTATDPAGKARKSCSDGLGRLTQVFEDPAGLNYETDYSYDALNNLIQVQQKGGADSSQWRSRTFAYDSLSRLTSATNPESGTITYTYDSNGNPLTRTDARNLITTYSYDALNRLTQKSYNDGTPTAQYFYDETSQWGLTLTNTKGRMSREQTLKNSATNAASIFSYDSMGRVLHRSQCTPSSCGTAGYDVIASYDLAGDVTSYTNGVGVTFAQTFDAAARITSITSSLVDTNHPATLWAADTSQGFFPSANLHKASFGNGVTETDVYQQRLQPCRININTTGSIENTCTDPNPNGTIQDFGYSYGTSGSTNNGNVSSWSASGQQSFSRTYSYDALNRLSTMSAPGDGCSGLAWVYDPWGNRTQQNNAGGSCPAPQTAVNANNRVLLSGVNYDAAGNMYADGTHTYAFDGENHVTTVDSGAIATYTYDAVGQRVEKNVGGTKTEYIYGIDGDVIAEVDGSTGSWQTGYAYLGASLIAEYKNNVTSPGAWSNGYTYRRTVTIDHAKVPNSDQSNFPVLVSGTYSYLANTSSGGNVSNGNGYDVIFTSDSAGATRLNFEVESYNSSTGAVNYWVKIPSLSHTSDTVIYMFYGNSSISSDQSNKTATWDSNYVAVYHLPNGSSLSANDSTSHGNNASSLNGATALSGEIAGAGSLNGSSNYIDVPSSSSFHNLSAVSAEVWVNRHAFDTAQIVGDGNGANSGWELEFENRSNNWASYFFVNNGTTTVASPESDIVQNTGWQFLVGTYDGSNVRIYRNGSVVGSPASQSGSTATTSSDLWMGRGDVYNADSYTQSDIDEVRISNIARSADWIAAEYNNESSPATFYSVGSASTSQPTNSNVTYFVHQDHLGSTRLLTSYSATPSFNAQVVDSMDYLPYGEQISGDTSTTHKFTGKERDAESGLDEFGARYMTSSLGRFMSADWAASPEPVPYAKLGNPQTLNLYAYVGNNPISGVDADGHEGASNPSEQTPSYPAEPSNCASAKVADTCPEPQEQEAVEGSQSTQQNSDQSKLKGPFVADLKSKEIAPLLDPNHTPSDSDIIGNGQCVTACSRFSGVTPDTKRWRAGDAVADNGDIKPGTAIATFGSNGHYPAGSDKNSAIYLGKGTKGSIWILDQWPAHPDHNTAAHPPQAREVRLDDGKTLSNSAKAYHVILVTPE